MKPAEARQAAMAAGLQAGPQRLDFVSLLLKSQRLGRLHLRQRPHRQLADLDQQVRRPLQFRLLSGFRWR
jgi:hypothetical protein